MSSLCEITPVSAFVSTNYTSKIESYQQLGQRILRSLGHPTINVEVHPDALYDNISLACEFFTKYAGFTQECLIFDSNLYEHNKGLRLDHLYTVANTGFTLAQRLDVPIRTSPDFEVDIVNHYYICNTALAQTIFSTSSALSGSIPSDGITAMQIIDDTTYSLITAFNQSLSSSFTHSPVKNFNVNSQPQTNVATINNMFDYDVMDYRKVISVVDYEEGSSTGVNTLFTMEQTLAQQTYYSYAMGNYGFDLVSWTTMKEWQETREKVLAIRKDIQFDGRTQYLKFYPQPKVGVRSYGVLNCYVERPVRDIIKEQWVYKYALALTKITWGYVLSKITGVSLLGGGSFNGDSIRNEGIIERDALEILLTDGASPGYGDGSAMGMWVG